MNLIALTLALGLQISGVWGYLPSSLRLSLVQSTATVDPISSTDTAVKLVSSLPVKTGSESLNLGAGSFYAYDLSSGMPLYQENADTARPIASITKLITAMVVLGRHKPDEIVTVGTLPTYQQADELIGIKSGEQYRVGDLVKAALIPSANDAADALAIYDSGSITKFAAQMNLKMVQWGIPNARFVSASGLTDIGNAVSAQSLAKIGSLALLNPIIATTVREDSATITSLRGRTFIMQSTNVLLASKGFHGIKTGYTEAAGECFIGLTQVNGHEVITVVLGSNDRFGDTQTLVNWIGRNYSWL